MARKIRCVTFDCYGTLIDWEKGIRGALLSLPAFRGDAELVGRVVVLRGEIEKGLIVSAPELPDSDTPEERYESLPYRPYREILAESIVLAARESGVDLDQAAGEAAAATMPDWDPFPDTCKALAEIGRRFPLGILSNVEDEVVEAAVRKLGVPFELIVTAERVESYKPSPDHWYSAMHELEADEEELFHIAASPFHDLETASLLGIPCGYVNRAGLPLLPEARPAFTVPDLAGAAARLKGLAPARASSSPGGASPRKTGGEGPDRPEKQRPRRGR